MAIKFWSLFAGIEGFGAGFDAAGMECVLQAEKEPSCQAVLRRHFPGVQRIDDVLRLRAMLERKNAGRHSGKFVRPDLICGGFPCQDLSVAGRRAGLAGSRSGLWFVFRRIIAVVRPGWVVIENVPGLLSSNKGRDMGAIVGALGQLGYRWAYRVLDSQYDGVAQRRRRVFIVASLGDRPHPAEILFDSDSLPGDSPPSRETGARVAAGLTAGVAAGSGVNRPGRRREDDVNLVAGTLQASNGGMGTPDRCGELVHCPAVSPAMKARDFKGPSSDGDGDGLPLIASTLNSGGNAGGFRTEPGEHLVPIAFAQNQRDEVRDLKDRAGALAAEPGMKQQTYVAFQCHGSNVGEMGTLRSGNGNESGGVPFTIQERAVSENPNNGPQGKGWQEDLAFTLEARSKVQAAATSMAVRRLLPVECEKLQGFSPGWTEYGADGEPISDSARYRMLGNAVCRNTAEWIGRRIVEAMGD